MYVCNCGREYTHPMKRLLCECRAKVIVETEKKDIILKKLKLQRENIRLKEQNKEMLEALIDVVNELKIFHDGNPLLRNNGELDIYIKLIEKATGMKWEEIND